jgi:spore germination protein KC
MMLRFMKAAVIWLQVSLLLAGCWDIKNPQDVNYFTAVGFDYKDNQYIVYAQMFNFANVAKLESGAPSDPPTIWVGRGVGETASSALNDLYDTAQLRVFYGQINAIIYSENMMKKGLQPIFDLQGRFYELRYTPWVFGVNQPIDEIMNMTSFFNLPPSMSLLHQPKQSYKQKSTILPIVAREFVSNFQEPGKTALLPSIGIVGSTWEKNFERNPMLDIDGIYIWHNGKYLDRLDEKQLMGLRWVEPETYRSPLLIRTDGDVSAALSLERPQLTITPTIQEDGIHFDLEVSLTGDIIQIVHAMPESIMEQQAAKQVRTEIEETFEQGLKVNADLLQLEYALYRQNNKQWKQLRDQGKLSLKSFSLDIEVSVNLTTAGKLKVYK